MVLSTLCFDAVFMLDIIIMVYSTVIISCSPSFVKGGICISPPICFVRIHHWLWSALVMILPSAGAVTRVCTEQGLEFQFFRLVNSPTLKLQLGLVVS